MFNRKIRGIGLLEIMLSLAIIALIVVMAARYFSVVREQQKITEALQMASTTLQAAHTWAVGQTSYPTGGKTLIRALVDSQLLPASYLEYRHPWGGFFDLKGKAEGQTLAFVFNGVNGTICSLLKEKLITKRNGQSAQFGDVTDIDC